MPTYRNKPSQSEWLAHAIYFHDSDECLLWPFLKQNKGYGYCEFEGSTVLTHRLAFFFTYHHWPTPHGLHKCDTPACFNPRHIFEGTQSENMLDAASKGRVPRGTKHPHVKLTEEIVREIRSNTAKLSQRALGAKFGVGQDEISRVVTRKIWRHVE